MIYILEFDRPLGTDKHEARYYIGYCEDGQLERRLKQHRAGTGAAITRAAAERGIVMTPIFVFAGDRSDERRLKREKNTPRLVRRLRRELYNRL